jgi:hypothetical protein
MALNNDTARAASIGFHEGMPCSVLATAVFAVAFLLMGLGAIFQSGAGREVDPRNIALLLLTGVSAFGNAVASIRAAVGFSRSRNEPKGIEPKQ